MSLFFTDLTGGDWQVYNDVSLSAYVTNQNQNADELRQGESELTRSNQRQADYDATKTAYDGFKAGLGTTYPAIAGTTPAQYLFEYPVNNKFIWTESQLDQAIATQTANEAYMTGTQIPNDTAYIAEKTEVMDNIQAEPVGGTNETFDFLPVPQNVPQGGEAALDVLATSTLAGEVNYIEVSVTLNHAPTEPVTIWLLSPGGSTRELFTGDFIGTETKVFQTSYFNGLTSDGVWTLRLHNAATVATPNELTAGSVKVFIP